VVLSVGIFGPSREADSNQFVTVLAQILFELSGVQPVWDAAKVHNAHQNIRQEAAFLQDAGVCVQRKFAVSSPKAVAQRNPFGTLQNLPVSRRATLG
jgi:hypothetical protein